MVDSIIIIAVAIVIAVFGVIGLGLWSQKAEVPATKRVYDSYTKTWFEEDPKTGKRTLAVLKK
jgi:hypothetical protein